MIFSPTNKQKAIDFLLSEFENNRYVKIERVTESKTLSQNAYLWLVFTHVGFQIGYTKDEMYCEYLRIFPKYKEVTNKKNEIKIIPISLSIFSKEQTKMFIEEVTRHARMEGFDVPDPADKRAVELYNYYKKEGYI